MRYLALKLLAVAIVLAGMQPLPARAQPPTSSSVILRYHGPVELHGADSLRVEALALDVLRSSNFNSSATKWAWDEEAIQHEYRSAISGDHLTVTYSPAAEINTVGGTLAVKELVVGLLGLQYASSVHTVDSSGRIVGHAKYSGVLCIQLLELVRSLPNNSYMDSSRK
jgi:hypothetical protein